MAKQRMKPKLSTQRSIYSPVTVNLVNLKHLESDFQVASADPVAYLAGTDPARAALPVTEDLRQRMQRTMKAMRDTHVPEEVIRTALEAISGTKLPDGYEALITRDTGASAKHILDYFQSDQDRARQAAMDLVELRAATNDASSIRLSARPDRGADHARMRGLGFEDIVYIERFPMLLASPGFKRLPDEAASRFNPFAIPGSQKRAIYVDPYETEAIVFQVDPARIESIVQAWCPAYAPSPNVSLPIHLGSIASAHLDEVMSDPSYKADIADPGSTVCTILHSLAHSAIKALSAPSGFNVNTFSEYLLPGGLAFAVFVNRTQENGIGGLLSVFNDTFADFVTTWHEQDRECLHDPKCGSDTRAACHACLFVSETTCRMFNHSLDRNTLHGRAPLPGFWP